jgi:xanthine dehydrogenase accessory factor
VTELISPADAAQAVLAVASGAPPVAVAAAVHPGGDVRRIIVALDGSVAGALQHPLLQEAALRRARQLLGSAAAGGSGVAGGAPVAVESLPLEGTEWLLYVEAHFPPEALVIVGAGHIAVPLAQLGVLLEFSVTVLDDREEFATTERFAEGVTVRRADFEGDPFEGIVINERSCIALVTRGHRWDFDCLQRMLASGARPRYIGMVGSRRRVRAAFHALLEAGTPRSELARIHAPIGIEIGAETPGEIAVSIAAELVAVRRGATGDSMSAREQVLDRFLKES